MHRHLKYQTKKKEENSELLLSLLFAIGSKTDIEYTLNIDNDIISANTYAIFFYFKYFTFSKYLENFIFIIIIMFTKGHIS
jgi:hypothetical protein